MRIRRGFLSAVLLLGAACTPTGEGSPRYERAPAVITWVTGLDDAPQSQVQVPASVQAGQPFTVVVTTWGGSCRRLDLPEVSTSGLRADVTVYEMYPLDGPCDRAVRLMEHRVELRLARQGTATVYIRGIGLDRENGAAPTALQHTVTVQ